VSAARHGCLARGKGKLLRLPEPARRVLLIREMGRDLLSWMSDNHFSREEVRSAHSVVDVRPLRRPTAEVEPRAAEPALDYLEAELRDRDR
jgi:hypothetical protein